MVSVAVVGAGGGSGPCGDHWNTSLNPATVSGSGERRSVWNRLLEILGELSSEWSVVGAGAGAAADDDDALRLVVSVVGCGGRVLGACFMRRRLDERTLMVTPPSPITVHQPCADEWRMPSWPW